MKTFGNFFENKCLTLTTFLLVIHSFITTFVLLYLFKNSDLWVSFRDSIQKSSEPPRFQNPKVLCLVTTQSKKHSTSVRAIKDTWGKRCDQLLFISDRANESLPSVAANCSKEDHDHLWCKNRQGIIKAIDRFGDQFDWFLKTDDDTYIIIENLKYLLSHYDPNQLIWFGCPFALGGNHNKTYMSGGAGYAISRKAILSLKSEFIKPNKCFDLNQGETGADDAEIGLCFKRLGVKLGDSRDSSHRNRFFPFTPGDFVNPSYNVSASTPWFAVYNIYRNQMGFNCCSNTTISFHYVDVPNMYVYDFFLYYMYVKTDRKQFGNK